MCHLSKGHATLRRSGAKALLIRISTLSPGGQLHREKYRAYCSEECPTLAIHLAYTYSWMGKPIPAVVRQLRSHLSDMDSSLRQRSTSQGNALDVFASRGSDTVLARTRCCHLRMRRCRPANRGAGFPESGSACRRWQSVSPFDYEVSFMTFPSACSEHGSRSLRTKAHRSAFRCYAC